MHQSAGETHAVPVRPLAAPGSVRIAALALGLLIGLGSWSTLALETPAARAPLGALTGLAVVVSLLGAGRLPGLLRVPAAAVVVLAGLAVAALAAGIAPRLLWVRGWDELWPGLSSGATALLGVRLPYAGASPWPAETLALLGGALAVLAAALTAWPGRRHPLAALALLLTLAVAPQVSLGTQPQPLAGGLLALLAVAFLYGDRLPRRPSAGLLALLVAAVAGGAQLGAAADRGDPWFDYEAFAAGLGGTDPVRFSWTHGYGPIGWPRDGRVVARMRTERPQYWKVRVLDEFTGAVWRDAGRRAPTDEDLPGDWRNRPSWTEEAEVEIGGMRTGELLTAGTALEVPQSSREVRRSGPPGAYRSLGELARGDSYRLRFYGPRPNAGQLQGAGVGRASARPHALVLGLPSDVVPEVPRRGSRARGELTTDELLDLAERRAAVRTLAVAFPPFGEREPPRVVGAAGPDDRVAARLPRPGEAAGGLLARSPYARSWRLAQRLRERARTPFEYVRSVDAYLRDDFSYTELPPAPAAGRAALDAFLFDGRAGYCQHFSGAMAMLLRMGGVPARVVTGFSPGGYVERRDEWVVRDTDAHSWVEAWFESAGWVVLDPTPGETPARSQIAALQAAPVPAEPAGAPDAAESDGAGDAAAGAGGAGLRGDLLLDRAGLDAGAAGDTDDSVGGGRWLLVTAPVTLLLLVGAWVVRRRRAAPADPVAELERALRRLGRPAPPGATLRDVERRLAPSDPEARAYLRALIAARYAPAAPDVTPAGRAALRRELAHGLGLSGRLRALWAFPPGLVR